MSNLSVEELQHAVADAHAAVAQLKAFIMAAAARNAAAAGLADAAAEAVAETYGDVLDACMSYLRTAVASAASGVLGSSSMVPLNGTQRRVEDPAAAAQAVVPDEGARLRTLVNALTRQLEAEIAVPAEVTSHDRQRLAAQLEALQTESSIVRLYKHRIRELLALMNCNQPLTAERLTTIVHAHDGEDKRSAQVASDLGRLAAQSREKLERQRAELLKLQSDRVALLAENSMLFDRVQALEAQVATITSSASSTLHELSRTRVRAAKDVASTKRPDVSRPATSASKLLNISDPSNAAASGPQTLRVGDVVIDRDVALWMKDMYVALSSDPDTSNLVPPQGKRPSVSPVVPKGSAGPAASTKSAQSPPPADVTNASRPSSGASTGPVPRGHPPRRAASVGSVPSRRSAGGSSGSFTQHVARMRDSSEA